MARLSGESTANPQLRKIFNSSYCRFRPQPALRQAKDSGKHTLQPAQKRIYPANAIKFEMRRILSR
jgi:hypothetical protein